MTSDGRHWADIELHFEWRQRVLDDSLAALSLARREIEGAFDRLRQTRAPGALTSETVGDLYTDLAAITGALAVWSQEQAALDRQAQAWKAANSSPENPPTEAELHAAGWERWEKPGDA